MRRIMNNRKVWIRLAIILVVAGVVYYFVIGKVNSDMDKNQQKMNDTVKQMGRTKGNY